MDWTSTDRRSGEDRRRNNDKKNGIAVFLAGCCECGRIPPSPAEMHMEGWQLEWNDEGLERITCPDHVAPAASDDQSGLPDYVVEPGWP